MKEKKNVYVIKKMAKGQKEYVNTGIVFSNFEGASEFAYLHRNVEDRYSYDKVEFAEGMKVYDSYEHFVSENPQLEIARLKEERDGLLVEFPFTLFIRNQDEGTVRLTKLVELNYLHVQTCELLKGGMKVYLTRDEYIDLDESQIKEFEDSVTKAKQEYTSISEQITKVKDKYVSTKKSEENELDYDEIYRAFEEE